MSSSCAGTHELQGITLKGADTMARIAANSKQTSAATQSAPIEDVAARPSKPDFIRDKELSQLLKVGSDLPAQWDDADRIGAYMAGCLAVHGALAPDDEPGAVLDLARRILASIYRDMQLQGHKGDWPAPSIKLSAPYR